MHLRNSITGGRKLNGTGVVKERRAKKGNTYEFLEHTLVQRPFGLSTCVVFLVVQLETVPVRVKLLKAVLAHLVDPERSSQRSVQECLTVAREHRACGNMENDSTADRKRDLQVGRAPCDSPTFL